MLVSKVSLSERVVCNSVLFCSFAGAVEAGIAHGLKKRAAGLLPAQDTQSVLLKLAKLSEPAAELVKKLSGEENANKDGKSTMPGTKKIITFCLLYPLSPKRDQCPFFPNNISTLLREKVTRIIK